MIILSSYRIIAGTLLGIMVLVATLLQYSHGITDSVIWHSMSYGRYSIDKQTIISDHTILCWTPVACNTIYCTWIPSIVLYLLYKAGHPASLFAIRYAILISLLFLKLFVTERKSITSVFASLLTLLFAKEFPRNTSVTISVVNVDTRVLQFFFKIDTQNSATRSNLGSLMERIKEGLQKQHGRMKHKHCRNYDMLSL